MKNLLKGLKLFSSRVISAKFIGIYTFMCAVIIIVGVLPGIKPDEDVYVATIMSMLFYFGVMIQAMTSDLGNSVSVRTSPYARQCMLYAPLVFFSAANIIIYILFIAAELIFRSVTAETLLHITANFIAINSLMTILSYLQLFRYNAFIAIFFVSRAYSYFTETLGSPVMPAVISLLASVILPFTFFKHVYETKACSKLNILGLPEDNKKEKKERKTKQNERSNIKIINEFRLFSLCQTLSLRTTLILSAVCGILIFISNSFIPFKIPVAEWLIFILLCVNMGCIQNLVCSVFGIRTKSRYQNDMFLRTVPDFARRAIPVYLMMIIYSIITIFTAPAAASVMLALTGFTPAKDIWSTYIIMFAIFSILPLASFIRNENASVTIFILIASFTALACTVFEIKANLLFLAAGLIISFVGFAVFALKAGKKAS